MKINTKKTGVAMAAAATMLLAACSSNDDKGSMAHEDAGKCHGANACKGHSECATNNHACAGQNACKGKGFITTTKAKCDAVNGGWDNARN